MDESTPPEDLTPEQLPGARHEPSPAGPVRLVVRQLLGQLAVVLGVAAVIAAVFGAAGLGTSGKASSGAGASASTTRSSSVGASSGSGSPSAPALVPASASPSSTGPASSPTVSATVTAASRPKVDVLNEAAAPGTAAALAARLKAAGWRIGRVADFRGTVSATTVYYPPALRRAARELAKDMPGSPRVQPGFSTLSPTRLSVVLVG